MIKRDEVDLRRPELVVGLELLMVRHGPLGAENHIPRNKVEGASERGRHHVLANLLLPLVHERLVTSEDHWGLAVSRSDGERCFVALDLLCRIALHLGHHVDGPGRRGDVGETEGRRGDWEARGHSPGRRA